MRLAIVILFLAAQAQAKTLYVSSTGKGTAPFLTWEEAATNIQYAINASAAGDTVLVAPGTYNEAVTINKNFLTVQGGNGTLWDADRTIIDLQGAVGSVGVTFTGATNSTLRGFSVIGANPPAGSGGITASAPSSFCYIESCVVRGIFSTNASTSSIRSWANDTTVKNVIVVGNYTQDGAIRSGVYAGGNGNITILNSIIEANFGTQFFSSSGMSSVANTIHGNSSGITFSGGNVTNNTTNSVMRLLSIAPASVGVGTNLQWAGVAAYIPRIGSLAQGAGVGYAGIDAAKSGDGGPALLPMGVEFLGRDSSTNGNHGVVGGDVTASTNDLFDGGGSASFGGSGAIVTGKIYTRTNWTIEAWVWAGKSATQYQAICGDKGYDGTTSGTTLGFNWATNTFSVRYGDIAGNNSRINSVLARSNWYHIAATKTGTTVTLYTNGAPAATGGTTTNACGGTGPFTIGKWTDSSLGNFDGNVAEVRIWSVARTPAEIAANYTNRLTGTEPGLVGYWRLDETVTNNYLDAGPFNIRNTTLSPTFMEAF